MTPGRNPAAMSRKGIEKGGFHENENSGNGRRGFALNYWGRRLPCAVADTGSEPPVRVRGWKQDTAGRQLSSRDCPNRERMSADASQQRRRSAADHFDDGCRHEQRSTGSVIGLPPICESLLPLPDSDRWRTRA